MLPRDRRIHRSGEFKLVMGSGLRVPGRLLVLYCLDGPTSDVSGEPARAGLIVGRGVGGSVTRHRVSRVLRHQLATRLAAYPGWLVVVRALPGIASADSQEVGVALDGAFSRAARRLSSRPSAVGHGVGTRSRESR